MDGGQTIVQGVRHRVWSGALALAVLVAVTAVGAPRTASAAVTGSIVYTQDRNVWIMAAGDPSTARAVTTDGRRRRRTSRPPRTTPAGSWW